MAVYTAATTDRTVLRVARTCTKMSHCFGSNIFLLLLEYLMPCMASRNRLMVRSELAIYDRMRMNSFRWMTKNVLGIYSENAMNTQTFNMTIRR